MRLSPFCALALVVWVGGCSDDETTPTGGGDVGGAGGGGGEATGGNPQGGSGDGGGTGGSTTEPLGLSPDPTFGEEGFAFFDSGGEEASVTASALQDDGKLIVAGATLDEDGLAFVLRLNADGTIDATYGVDGKVLLPRHRSSVANAITLQPDGKLLVAGRASIGEATFNDWVSESFVARLDEDGALDATFGIDGFASLETGERANATALSVTSGDTIVVGASLDQAPRLIQLDDEGAVDTTFGAQGVAEFEEGFGDVRALATTSDGAILGLVLSIAESDSFISRFSASGTYDSDFGVLSSFSDWFAMGVDGSDRIVVAGDEVDRYLADGSYDPSFPSDTTNDVTNLHVFSDGSFLLSIDNLVPFDDLQHYDEDNQLLASFTAGIDDIQRFVVADDGTVTAVGQLYTLDDPIAVGQVASDGTPVTTFGEEGIASVATGAGEDDFRDAAFATDGAIFVRSRQFFVGKVSAGGTVDPTFAGDGVMEVPNTVMDAGIAPTPNGGYFLPIAGGLLAFGPDGEPDESIGGGFVSVVAGGQAFAITTLGAADGAVLVAGRTYDGSSIVIRRLLADGSSDPSFAAGDAVFVSPTALPTSAAATPAGGVIVTAAGRVVLTTPSGELDESFGGGGTVGIDAALMTRAMRAVFTDDGDILVAGTRDDCEGPGSCAHETVVVRLDPSGVVDTSFGEGGALRFASTGYEEPSDRRRIGLALDPNGGVLVATGAMADGHTELTILRASTDGVLDEDFGDGGVMTLGDRGNWHARDARFVEGGKLLVLGEAFSPYGGNDVFVARFLPDR